MSRKGYYIGGHTVIGPRSGWFSFGTGGKETGGKTKRRRQAATVAETKRPKQVKDQKAAKAAAAKIATQKAWQDWETDLEHKLENMMSRERAAIDRI